MLLLFTTPFIMSSKKSEEEPSALEILQAMEEEKQRVREMELVQATQAWKAQQKKDFHEEQGRLKKKEKQWKKTEQKRVDRALWYAAKTGILSQVASLIIDHGAVDGAYRSGDNWSASEVAEHEGYDHIVEWFELGERSARTYKRASRKEQEELDEELYQSVRDSNFEETKALLFEGARPDGHQNFWGLTSLHKATLRKKKGGIPTMQLLIEAGADVNAVDRKDGSTPLHKAAKKGYATKIEWLLLHGANINAQNYNLESALFCATDHGHVLTVRLLVNHGADIKIQNRTTRDACQLAKIRDSIDHNEIVKFLNHVPWNVAETRADRKMIFEKAMKQAEKYLNDIKEMKRLKRHQKNYGGTLEIEDMEEMPEEEVGNGDLPKRKKKKKKVKQRMTRVEILGRETIEEAKNQSRNSFTAKQIARM